MKYSKTILTVETFTVIAYDDYINELDVHKIFNIIYLMLSKVHNV